MLLLDSNDSGSASEAVVDVSLVVEDEEDEAISVSVAFTLKTRSAVHVDKIQNDRI